jgi:pimeloyl-ACP methyl ester carboxylesterase
MGPEPLTAIAAPSLDATCAALAHGGAFYRWKGLRGFLRQGGIEAIDPGQPIVLFIHGFPTASLDWQPIWPVIETRHAWLAPDLLGLGFSAKPIGHRYSVAEQADWCEAVTVSQPQRRIILIAHDYGDTVAQELLARQRDGKLTFSIERVFFLNGGMFPETHRPLLLQRALAHATLGPWLARLTRFSSFARSMRNIGGANPPSPTELAAMWTMLQYDQGRRAMPSLLGYIQERRLHRERWVGAVANADIPLTLINGLADPISGQHMADRYRELVPHADVVGLHEVGHYPQIEAPDAVAAAIMARL